MTALMQKNTLLTIRLFQVSPGLGHGHGHGHAHFEDLSTSTPSTPADMPLVHPLTPESDPCSPRSFPLF